MHYTFFVFYFQIFGNMTNLMFKECPFLFFIWFDWFIKSTTSLSHKTIFKNYC